MMYKISKNIIEKGVLYIELSDYQTDSPLMTIKGRFFHKGEREEMSNVDMLLIDSIIFSVSVDEIIAKALTRTMLEHILRYDKSILVLLKPCGFLDVPYFTLLNFNVLEYESQIYVFRRIH